MTTIPPWLFKLRNFEYMLHSLKKKTFEITHGHKYHVNTALAPDPPF